MAKETVYRYSLRTAANSWLGEIILTEGKEIYSLTDWGNFNFSWSTPMKIREFILSIDTDYFARKMFQGVAYQCSTNAMRGYCERFAAKILPVLQEAIKEELASNLNANTQSKKDMRLMRYVEAIKKGEMPVLIGVSLTEEIYEELIPYVKSAEYLNVLKSRIYKDEKTKK